jgi:hypothetical protein
MPEHVFAFRGVHFLITITPLAWSAWYRGEPRVP